MRLGERTVQQLVGKLDTTGLIDTWMKSEGGGQVMYVETTFDPEWVYEAQAAVVSESVQTSVWISTMFQSKFPSDARLEAGDLHIALDCPDSALFRVVSHRELSLTNGTDRLEHELLS